MALWYIRDFTLILFSCLTASALIITLFQQGQKEPSVESKSKRLSPDREKVVRKKCSSSIRKRLRPFAVPCKWLNNLRKKHIIPLCDKRSLSCFTCHNVSSHILMIWLILVHAQWLVTMNDAPVSCSNNATSYRLLKNWTLWMNKETLPRGATFFSRLIWRASTKCFRRKRPLPQKIAK